MVLLGPSGCGKTTTLRMITGLESITSGTIRLGDRVVNNLTPQQRNVAMAFETYALYPPLTVYENIAFPLQVMKRNNAEIDKRVREVAASLSISNILDKYPEGLAGGQKQRVSLARALVREPTVFLMDEPLSHVDADVRYRARAEIKHIHVTHATVIYVTHDQVEAVALADRVVVMDLGVIQQIGTPRSILPPGEPVCGRFHRRPPTNLVPCKLEFSNGKMHLAFKGDGQMNLSYTVMICPLQPIVGFRSTTSSRGRPRPRRKEISLAGKFSKTGLRQLLSVIDSPVSGDAAAECAERQPGRSAGGASEEVAEYFRNVTGMASDLKDDMKNAKNLASTSMFCEKYAKRIDRLPILNVDEELVQYGAYVASQLRQAAMSVKTMGIQTNVRSADVTASGDYRPPSAVRLRPLRRYGYRYGANGRYAQTAEVKAVGTERRAIRPKKRRRGHRRAANPPGDHARPRPTSAAR